MATTPVYPRATGMPNYSADSGGNFISEMWSSRIQIRFYKDSVYRAISNNDYEGEISQQGDTVHINTYPDITIFNYVKGMTLPVQVPSSTAVALVIDKGKAYNFAVDSVDKVQSKPDLIKTFTETAGKQMAETIDQDVMQGTYSGADSSNIGLTAGTASSSINMGASGSGIALTKVNIIEKIQDARTVLNEQNIPDDGQSWIVLPPIFTNLIGKSDLKDASLSGDAVSIIRNGQIGLIANMKVYQSNNLATVSDSGTHWYCIFGHPSAISFAEQLVETRAMQDPSTFGWKISGLHVYGYDVVKATSLGYLYAKVG